VGEGHSGTLHTLEVRKESQITLNAVGGESGARKIGWREARLHDPVHHIIAVQYLYTSAN
jgi:hypothetical protein